MIEQKPDFVDGAKLLRPLRSLPAYGVQCETWHKEGVEGPLPGLLLDLCAAGRCGRKVIDTLWTLQEEEKENRFRSHVQSQDRQPSRDENAA